MTALPAPAPTAARAAARTTVRSAALAAALAAALLALATLSAPRVLAADVSEFAARAPERLAEYIRVVTENPPGNESRGVAFLADVLEAAGIPYETAESAPGRGNLWARLPGGDEPGLVLLHHIDVVAADRRYWRVDPYAGEIRDGYVYGRGALDMKGLGIVQLQAFLALHASGAALNRDVLLVATADEEAGGAFGAGWLVENRPELFADVGYLLNEGGSGLAGPGEVVFTVEVTQKVPLWLRLTARGTPGHGSTPQHETAVTRLLRAGDRLARTRFPAQVVPAVRVMFEGMAPYQGEPLRARYADIQNAVRDAEFLRYLELTNPAHHALLRNTCSLTRLEGSPKINVVPAEATLELDCRLLPDQDPNSFVDDLTTIVNDPDVAIERLMAFTPAVSSTDTPLYRIIEALLAETHPGSWVVPGVTTGFTDSHFFRDLGIVSYGWSPFVIPLEDQRGVHGNNERISVENLVRGTDVLVELLRRLAAR